MKKIFSIVLTAAILLSTCVFGATAATDPSDYSENLIAYWDFEPDSVNGKLADKATAGTYLCNFTEIGTDTASVSYANGSVTVPRDAGVFLKSIYNKSDEINAIKEETTIGVKLNISEVDESCTGFLVAKANHFALLVLNGTTEGTYKIQYRNESSRNYAITFDKEFECGVDYYIFVTVKLNSDEKTATAVGYWSGNDLSFTKGVENTALNLSTQAQSNKGIIRASLNAAINVGTANNAKNADTAFVATFDDIWIFNAAVNADSLPVIAKGGFHYTDGEAKTAPAFRGSQVSPITEDKHALRLVGTVDSTSYAEVGFKVQVTDYKSASYNEQAYMTTTVYNSILGSTTNGNWITYTAAQLGGTYIYALTLEGIPTDATVTLKVTPCYKLTEGGETLTGESYTVVIENGKIVSQTVVA